MKQAWSSEDTAFLVENFPRLGQKRCAEVMGRSQSTVRSRAYAMGLSSKGSDAQKTQHARAGMATRGRKRPDQSLVMKQMWADGRIKPHANPSKRMKTCAFCGIEYWHKANSTCGPECATKAMGRITEAKSAAHKTMWKNNPHPRGMLGKNHTEGARRRMGASHSERWANMPAEEIEEHVMKVQRGRRAAGVTAVHRHGASWKAAWREIGGKRKYYRSRWEANYARYLQWLKEQGSIEDWSHESDVFWFEGIRRGVVSYLPDFKVTTISGSVEYHEVKGWMDSRSRTTIKRMAKYHPTVRLVVADKDVYRSLEKGLAYVIPGWEFP
jgi:hypothetical protein